MIFYSLCVYCKIEFAVWGDIFQQVKQLLLNKRSSIYDVGLQKKSHNPNIHMKRKQQNFKIKTIPLLKLNKSEEVKEISKHVKFRKLFLLFPYLNSNI